jgi:lipopolysaccharide export system permease protein
MMAESELVVMQATGFSPLRLARPILAFGLVAALLLSALTHVLVPLSRARLNERNSELSGNISAKFLTEGRFMHPAPGVTIFIRRISPAGELGDFFLSDQRTPGAETIYTAERAFLSRSPDGPKLVMLDGQAQRLDRDSMTLSLTRFGTFTYDIGAMIAGRAERPPELGELPTPALLAADADLLARTGASRAEALAEGHNRIAMPLLTIALVFATFAAMLTGSFSRFGASRQIALASALFILLYFSTNLAGRLAESSGAAVWIGYAPALLAAFVGAVLVGWSSRTRRPRGRRPLAGGAPA